MRLKKAIVFLLGLFVFACAAWIVVDSNSFILNVAAIFDALFFALFGTRIIIPLI